MRMGGDAHSVLLIGGSKVIDKAPGADGSDIAVRERPLNIDTCSGRQFNGARSEDHGAGE